MEKSPKRVAKVRHLDSSSTYGSQGDGSALFSEQNPLTTADPSSLGQAVPKKPKAVALHGWQRTVAQDEDYTEEPVNVQLGAPGTGLIQKAPSRNHVHSASLGAIAVGVDPGLEGIEVTREDKKEAKSLRALPVDPQAFPLPSNARVVSETETDASSSSSVEESLDSPSDATAKRKKERNFDTQSSSASSDLSFMVNTAGTGTFFGTRPTFGRAVEPRIPATVGEERLHNSLAQYFHKSRKESNHHISGEFAGAESRTSSVTLSQDKDRSGRGTVSSTPVTVAKTETRESSLDDFPAKLHATVGATPSTRTGMSGDNGNSDAKLPSDEETKRPDGTWTSANGDSQRTPAAATKSASKASAGSQRRSTASRSPDSMEEGLFEEGAVLEKNKHVESELRVEPGRRGPKCGCLSGWPWKVLTGLVMLVAVVTVVVMANSGDVSDGRRRLAGDPRGVLTDPWSPFAVSGTAHGHSRRKLAAVHREHPANSAEDVDDEFSEEKPPGGREIRDTSRRRTSLPGRVINII